MSLDSRTTHHAEPDVSADRSARRGRSGLADSLAAALCALAAAVLISVVAAPPLVAVISGLAIGLIAMIWGRSIGTYSGGQGKLVAAGSAGLVAAVIGVFALATNFWTDADNLFQTLGLSGPTQSNSQRTVFVTPGLGQQGTGGPSGQLGSDALSEPSTPSNLQEPQRLIPDLVTASEYANSSSDSAGNTVTFVPENVVDTAEDTAWRVPGNGVYQTVTLTWNTPIRVQYLGLIPGYTKIDIDGTDRFTQNRRVTEAEFLDSAGRQLVRLAFVDSKSVQGTMLDNVIVTSTVIVRILATTPPGDRDYTAISEIYVGGQP